MSSSDSQSEQIAKFISFLRGHHKREERRRSELSQLVKTVPVPDEVLHEIMWPYHEILQHHPGYATAQKLIALGGALELLDQTHKDLLSQIEEFHTFSLARGFASRAKRKALDGTHLRVRKELLAFSAAAASLVDHARRLNVALPIKDLSTHRARHVDQVEHQFVIDLRNLISHGQFPSTSWQIDYLPTRTTDFVLPSRGLLESGELTARARAYVQRAGERIYVRRLADSYISKIKRYYDWYRKTIEEELPAPVVDYRRCERICRLGSARSGYKLVLTEALNRKVDPYEHLDRYLLPHELEAAKKLPHRSMTQVDYIISVADEYGACDDEIRGIIYKLFGVASQD